MGRRIWPYRLGRHLRRAGYRRDWCICLMAIVAVMEERKIRREKKFSS